VRLQSNIFGGGGAGGGCLDDAGSLYMNTDVGLSADISKSSPPLTPSSSSRSGGIMKHDVTRLDDVTRYDVVKHDVSSCLPGYAVGYSSSAAAAAAAAAAADFGCHRPFHSPPTAGSTFGESMLDQLQVVPGHPDPAGAAAASHQLQPMYPASVYATQRGYYHMPQSVHFGGPAGGAGGSSGGLHGGSTADLHHAGGPGSGVVTASAAECDTRELEAFAEHFKQRRIKIGVTQADVGSALGKLKLPGVGSLSQSTICRFESLTLSHNNMVALKPVLQAWLEEAEAQARDSRMRTDLFAGTANGVDRKRKRTSIATPEKRSLEAYFAIQPRPSGEKIAQIAEKLDLKKNVVRVWFCNQRQKQKRMKFAASAL